MLVASAPTPIPAVWGNGASSPYINTIPTPSQQMVKAGAASFTDGFPPLCFVPFATGGAGPFGADFNGILAQVSAGLQWVQAGNNLPYSGAYSTIIGGYANGAIVESATTPGLFWRSTVDSNVTNPDTGGAGWVAQTNSARYAHGECRLAYASTTSYLLSPYNGNNIVIEGVQYQIPAAGISVANTGIYLNGTAAQNLAANTRYYLSLAVIAGALTPRFWTAPTYGHMPDTTAGNIGIEVISLSGDPTTTDTLIAQVQTAPGANTFIETLSNISGTATLGMVNWFNRRPRNLNSGPVIGATASSTSYAELNASYRIIFQNWGDGVTITAVGSASNNGPGQGSGLEIAVDGTATDTAASINTSSSANYVQPLSTTALVTPGEGGHYAQIFGATVTGGMSTFTVGLSAQIMG